MNKQQSTFVTIGDLVKNSELFRIKPAGSRLFDRYVMVDYSGARDDRIQKKSIFIANLDADSMDDLIPGCNGFTRNSLREYIILLLREATKKGERVLVGIDHQFSWPQPMLELCNIDKLSWREAIQSLTNGTYGGPPLDHPDQFCSKFNSWIRNKRHIYSHVFYCQMRTRAEKYDLPTMPPTLFDSKSSFRTTEKFLKALGHSPGNAFSIVNHGAVGGQTICGMKQLAMLLDDLATEGIKVACWPYDGISINEENYSNKHVLLEIYPTLLRPESVQQTDKNDACESARYCWYNDKHGQLTKILDLTALITHKNIILNEGWILGCVENYENYMPLQDSEVNNTHYDPIVNLKSRNQIAQNTSDIKQWQESKTATSNFFNTNFVTTLVSQNSGVPIKQNIYEDRLESPGRNADYYKRSLSPINSNLKCWKCGKPMITNGKCSDAECQTNDSTIET